MAIKEVQLDLPDSYLLTEIPYAFSGIDIKLCALVSCNEQSSHAQPRLIVDEGNLSLSLSEQPTILFDNKTVSQGIIALIQVFITTNLCILQSYDLNKTSTVGLFNALALERIFLNMSVRYESMLAKFRPCKPGSAFLEQNLITLLSHEFLSMFPDGIAFSEVPFQNKDSIWGYRIDGYLANDWVAYFVEAKGDLLIDDLMNGINGDLDRIHEKKLKESFAIMANNGLDEKGREDRTYHLPSSKKGIIIANTWDIKTKDAWLNKTLLKTKYVNNLAVKAYSVGKYGYNKKHELFILTGVTTHNIW